MKIIKASQFCINPGENITEKLAELTEYLASDAEEKTVVFDKGTYYIDSEKCKKYMLHITNTVGDKEFKKGETPHLNAVPFYFGNVENVTVDGGDSVFVINGKVTNIAMEHCKNITVKNLEIRHSIPDMHELKVIKKSLFGVDFKIDEDTQYKVKNGKLYFFGTDYNVCSDKKALNASWIGLIRKETPNKIQRVVHPLFSTFKVEDLGNRKIRAYFTNTFRFKNNDCFYIFDVRRQFAGIFVNKCENVTLQNIKQRFNYSLALVAQDSENITVDSVEFAPEKGSPRKVASVADFIQICMCRGKVTVKDSYFNGAGDDCLNVHGIHFKITDIKDNALTVRFMHPQSHGFNPLRAGDTIAYIDADSLLEKGSAVIEKSELLNEYEIAVTVSDTAFAEVGEVIEDVTACPDLDFVNNKMTRIITRGLLITTRGKVNVINNRFISTTMSGILLSDDAKSWYESGMCTDVTICDNTFEYCGKSTILIKPENSVYKGAVHKNIKIKGNTFLNCRGYCIDAKSSDNIEIKNNDFSGNKKIKTENCNNVTLS